MNTPTLNRSDFEAWLATFTDEEEIGVACSHILCPIAEYITSQPGVTLTSVAGDESITIMDGPGYLQVKMALPAWAIGFRDLIDMLYADDPFVTAGTAREILARIPAEVTP